MSLLSIYQTIATTEVVQRAAAWLNAPSQAIARSLRMKGGVGSTPAFISRYMQEKSRRLVVYLLPDAEAAAYLHSDLEQLGDDNTSALLFPPTNQKPYDAEQIAEATPLIQRADVLQQLVDGFDGLLVVSLDALFELVPPAE
ncbi:MAG TPA: hypothetical protein VKP65_13135, partial [Rhodothermales bacterium]|nr:hypothetical protein [Rhodothermales bacterium]